MNFKVIWMIILAVGIAAPAHADDAGLSYADFAAGVSLEANTSLGAKAFWQSHYKQIVTWSADVVEVKGHRRGAEILLAKPGYPLNRGYNIVLIVADRNAAGVLKRGDTLRFQGQLERYKGSVGRPMVVYLSNGQLLNATTTVSGGAAAGNPQTDFAVFAGLLSCDKNTKVAANAHWESLRRQGVTWKAAVVDVKGGRRGADVYLSASGAPLYRGYNIVVDNLDLARASTLKKGQTVTVRGTPARYTYRRGAPVVVTLRYGEILSQ